MKKIIKIVIGIILALIIGVAGMYIYIATHPVTDCDSCLNGTTL